MCRTAPPKTLFLRSTPAGNMGNGLHEFRDIDITHWENSPLWAIRCVGWHMLNEIAVGMGGRNEPSLSLHLEGFGTGSAASLATPLALALPDANLTYRSLLPGAELVGSLEGRVLRFSTRNSRDGALLPCDTWVAILECRPVENA